MCSHTCISFHRTRAMPKIWTIWLTGWLLPCYEKTLLSVQILKYKNTTKIVLFRMKKFYTEKYKKTEVKWKLKLQVTSDYFAIFTYIKTCLKNMLNCMQFLVWNALFCLILIRMEWKCTFPIFINISLNSKSLLHNSVSLLILYSGLPYNEYRNELLFNLLLKKEEKCWTKKRKLNDFLTLKYHKRK